MGAPKGPQGSADSVTPIQPNCCRVVLLALHPPASGAAPESPRGRPEATLRPGLLGAAPRGGALSGGPGGPSHVRPPSSHDSAAPLGRRGPAHGVLLFACPRNDYKRSFALAVSGDGDDKDRIVGVGRYIMNERTGHAETAIVVHEEYRR